MSASIPHSSILIRHLGLCDYSSTLQAMQTFTDWRNQYTTDEIWILEHHPVFTQGQAGKEENILDAKNIPVIQTDRGGQVTYHEPGQLIFYFLIDLKRKKIGIKEFVNILEQSVLEFLSKYNLQGVQRKNAPGIYLNDQKICSIGLKVKQGCTYHGLSINIDMDLKPFLQINPCGFKDLKITQLKEHVSDCSKESVASQLLEILKQKLSYDAKQQ